MLKRKQPIELVQAERPYFDENGYFRFRVVSSDARHATQLKEFPRGLITWLERFESSCVLDCCGLNALSFKLPTEWDKRWNFNSQTVKLLEAVREEALKSESDVLNVFSFHESLYRDDLLFLLDYLQEGMKKSIEYK